MLPYLARVVRETVMEFEALPLRCSQCSQYVLSNEFSKKVLKGDSFYIFKCSNCSEESKESFQRLPMSWLNVIQLVLFHLWESGDHRHRYFRWKEDICNTIEERWDDLIPTKPKSPSWSNSVSSVLSANEKIFASGVAIKGAPGWWSLHHWEAPQPRSIGSATNSIPYGLVGKRSYENFNEDQEGELLISSEDENILKENSSVDRIQAESRDKEAEKDIIIDTEEDEMVEKSSSEPSEITAAPSAKKETSQTPVKTTPTIVPSEGLKKQLLERLLKMDSSLLHEAIKKAKAKKLAEVYSLNNPSKTGNDMTTTSDTNTDILKDEGKIDKAIISNDSKNAPTTSQTQTTNINVVITPRISDSELNAYKFKYPPDAQVIRASPYENDLLKKCNRVLDDPLPGGIARLRRKLLMRRQKRKVGIPLFDLDNHLYSFLKATEIPLRVMIDAESDKKAEPGLPSESFVSTLKTNADVDQNENIIQGAEIGIDESLKMNIDLKSIPYISDPTKSMYVKLTGMAAVYGCCPYPVTSPFTGKLLPAFLERETCTKIPKLNVLNELRKIFFMLKCGNFNEENSEKEFESEIDFSGIVLPSMFGEVRKERSNNLVIVDIITDSSDDFEPLTLDYTNLRKEFVGQINDLLSDSFWPGIDVSDALECPDYAIVVLVGLSVVACAFVTPDGYLSYLHVRPDFQSHGLAKNILFKLLRLTSAHMDITLHVSVTNESAILLYQKFGFKPEEFVVNFYDKFYPEEYTGNSRNAFLMRLRR